MKLLIGHAEMVTILNQWAERHRMRGENADMVLKSFETQNQDSTDKIQYVMAVSSYTNRRDKSYKFAARCEFVRDHLPEEPQLYELNELDELSDIPD